MHKPEWLSKAVERLLQNGKGTPADPYDVVIVGSGYGAAVAAARLAGCTYKNDKNVAVDVTVCILERGSEHLPGTFPDNFSELPGHIRYSRFDDPVAKGAGEGLFDLRIGKDVAVLIANGLGGGSLINAGVTAAPDHQVFSKGWPKTIEELWGTPGAFARDSVVLCEQLAAADAPTTYDGGKGLRKHREFLAIVQDPKAETAKITVDPKKCVQCGDCATGCNEGAKRTLPTTYLAEAWRCGAELYTGATVSHVKRRADGIWSVFVAPTTLPRPLPKQGEELREVCARTVILAAGALGSPEILMRSRVRSPELRFSEALGTRFSTNGDMIAAMYKRGAQVRAAPEEHTARNQRNVGPTITGLARGRAKGKAIVFEELAIPGALRGAFEEVITTSAMLASLGRLDEDDEYPVDGDDPAAVDPRIIDGCQVLAAMGDDEAKGRLELVPAWNDPAHLGRVRDGAIRVHWPDAGREDVFAAEDELFRKMAMSHQWTYLPSPMWQPLPRAISSSLSGEKPAGMLFSVHPLGGCPMADDIAGGVVDHEGRVFAPDTPTGFHEGLLVLDGSIVPTALGVNPLLTITALADRASKIYRGRRNWSKASDDVRPMHPPKIDRAPVASANTEFAFSFDERMSGRLAFPGARSEMQAELTLEFTPIVDLRAFLRRPHLKHRVKGKLQIRERGASGRFAPKVDVDGHAELLRRERVGRTKRMLRALLVYIWTRAVPDWIARRHERRRPRPDTGSRLSRWIESARGYISVASHVGTTRHLHYEFTLGDDLKDAAGTIWLGKGTTIKGSKTLKYGLDANPWRQLIDLEVTAHKAGRQLGRLGILSVDPAYFFHGFESRLRVTKQRDLPATWMNLASLGLFLARIVLKIHFWSFRLPEYQPYDPGRDIRRIPGELLRVPDELEPLLMRRYMVGYPEAPRDAGIFLPVTRYRAREDSGKDSVVVLFHGLGSGGIQYSTPRVKPNMAQYLASRGFDVWVAELRTSIALPYSLDQWSLDEVARGDIPRIIDFVLDETGADQVKVVAHCIGSAMFCTAVLDGRLQHTSGKSKIRSAALLQVGPLITLSKGTRLRGLATAPLRRFFPEGHLDFSVDDRAGWVEAMIDRLLATYPYPPQEAKHHRLGWSWKRNSHIANCNRWAAIDGRMFDHDNLTPEMLDALGEVLGHSSLTTWAQTIQYAFLERLTDSEARNSYVTTENVRSFFTFPVFFVHGQKNDVFDPLTSLRSAELIRRVHGPDAVRLKLLPKYGHFDPLIGREAARDVFEPIREFLAADHARSAQPKADAVSYYFVRRPLIGPLLGWTRWDPGEAKWKTRIWCRVDDLRSPASCVVVHVAQKDAAPGHGSSWTEIVSSLDVGPIDTVVSLDVPLAAGGLDYELKVLSLHDAGAADPLAIDGLAVIQDAEAAADKRFSATAPVDLPADATALRDLLAKDPKQLARLEAAAQGDPDDAGYDDKIYRAAVSVPELDEADALTFALGSCRYPGWMFDRSLADSTFGELRSRLAERGKEISALFLIGDQIYADATGGAFDPKDRRERFYEAYREAWTAPNARAVLSHVPVYMMMDDHEAGNDWHPEDALSKEDEAMREHGIEAFRRYQWLHSPQDWMRAPPPPGEPRSFYYLADVRGFPFFVCDTRRRRNEHGLLDQQQFDALIAWLRKCRKERPKFIVSPSAVVPFLQEAVDYPGRSDGWERHRGQLDALLSTILQDDIGDVVFLCGDSHLAMESEITFRKTGAAVGPKVSCIMASPLYAPYPFANGTPGQYLRDGELPLRDGSAAQYHVKHCFEGSSFTRVRVFKQGTWQVIPEVLPARPVSTKYLSKGPVDRPVVQSGKPIASPATGQAAIAGEGSE